MISFRVKNAIITFAEIDTKNIKRNCHILYSYKYPLNNLALNNNMGVSDANLTCVLSECLCKAYN